MMDRLTNAEIDLALEELIPCLGVKEESNTIDLVDLLHENDVNGCILGIAGILGLPIQIKLSLVPAAYRSNRSGGADGFQTSYLSRTDGQGHGFESITAQVQIPPGLPMFGTPELKGYPVPVRVSENCYEQPDTFLAIMAHELSHVLLASIRYLKKDNELHTDLVPILSGLAETVRRGRKVERSAFENGQTVTRTTTYGYLPDAQFDYACRCIKKMLDRYRPEKKALQKQVYRVRKELEKVARDLAIFRDYYAFLDEHPVVKMKNEHARRIVELHTQDFSREWERTIAPLEKCEAEAGSFAAGLDHYTTRNLERIKAYTRDLGAASEKLDALEEQIRSDNKILGSYIGFISKLKTRSS